MVAVVWFNLGQAWYDLYMHRFPDVKIEQRNNIRVHTLMIDLHYKHAWFFNFKYFSVLSI